MDEFPVVVGETGCPTHRPAHGRRNRIGGETQHEHVFGKRRAHGRCDRLGVHIFRQPIDGEIDVGESRIGLQEEIASQVEVGDPPVDDLEIGDDELATRNLEFTMHRVPPAVTSGRASRAFPASLLEGVVAPVHERISPP